MREKLSSVYDEITDRALFEIDVEHSTGIVAETGLNVEGFIVSLNGCPVIVTRSEGHSAVRIARMSPIGHPAYLYDPTDAQIIDEIRRQMV